MKNEKDNVDYKELYFKLFNSITDIIENLKKIQCEAEKNYIESKIKTDENFKNEIEELVNKIKKKF